jgi:hypothetical protein
LTYPKLNRDGEEIYANCFGDLLSPWDTREEDIAWLDDALLSTNCVWDS